MNENLYTAHENLPRKICMLTAPDAHCENESYKGIGNILAHTDTDTTPPPPPPPHTHTHTNQHHNKAMSTTTILGMTNQRLNRWVLREVLKDCSESLSLMLPDKAFQKKGATDLKARWPYHFVLQSLGRGTSRRELDTDLR